MLAKLSRRGRREAADGESTAPPEGDLTAPPDGDPTALPSDLTGDAPPVTPVVVPRWIQLVLLPIALLALWALARAAGTVLLILIAASTIALLLNPLARKIEARHLPRGLSILAVYLVGLALLGGLGALVASPISSQISRFQRDVPQLVRQANGDLASAQMWLDRNHINVHLQHQGQTALQTLQKSLLRRSGAIVSFSRGLLSQIVSFGFDLVLMLVLSVYLLIYGADIGRLVRRVMPAGDGSAQDDFPLLVQQAVFGYMRGQFLFSVIMGTSAAVSLWVFGVLGIFPDGSHYALFFGAFYGLMEFIPYIGPIIGPLPAMLVALFNDPISALWLVVLFVALQQLEGHVVAPQVFRISLRINPILIILGLLLGTQLYGIVGAIVALPVAAVLRQTVVYLRRHLVLEPWTPAVAGGGGPLQMVTAAEACPSCGAARGPGDAFCRSCGRDLSPMTHTGGQPPS